MKEKIFLKIVLGLLIILLLIPANLVAGGGGGGGGAAGGGGMGGHGGVGGGSAMSGDSQDLSGTGPHSSGMGQDYIGHEPMDHQGSRMMGPQVKGGRGAAYHRYSGYRDRPYDKNRHYAHQDYRGHRYTYQGHWRSWDQWDRYQREHPDIRRHGRYYRESGHLMFRFRDPGTGNYFFFSIGR